MSLRYVELFAGGGGLSLGLDRAGWSCVAHAEIEPHARAVLRERWPDTPLFGDVTAIDGAQWRGLVDVISGGSPCQDMSVAGKRAGLGGARSSLFHQQVRIWHESHAPYLLWENVPGALSSNVGADFATVLSTIVGAPVAIPLVGRRPKWQRAGLASGPAAVAAWRVLDLQHFGPPQRRARVFIVAARAGGLDPAEILALAEGVCGHPAPRAQAREGVAGTAAGSAGAGGVIGTLRSTDGGPDIETPVVLGFQSSQSGMRLVDTHATLDANNGSRRHNGVIAFHQTQDPISSASASPTLGRTSSGMGVLCTTGDVTHTLTHEGADASEDGTGRGTPIVANTITAREAKGWNPARGIGNGPVSDARPRRLTPLECERLMSWPDGHTRYGVSETGKRYALSDTARYRICGNGVGSDCAEWIARRFSMALPRAAA